MRQRILLSLLGLLLCAPALPSPAYAAVDLAVSFNLSAPPPVAIAPPALPIYVVPAPPQPGYIWTPGHWRWGGYGYFWVPGTWVQPPMVGVLWTPGYWGWRQGVFAWNEGYWGPHVGFYGGINYGGGYGGAGFVGGSWNNGAYVVNRSVTNVTNITNVTNVTNASFSGGPGGTTAVPTAAEQSFAHEQHVPPTQSQIAHIQAASQNPALAASANHGKPSIAATQRAGDFTHGVVEARQAGARNNLAEQHNAAVRKNPALAKGGAMPRANAGERPHNHPEVDRDKAAHPEEGQEPRGPGREMENRQPAPGSEHEHHDRE